MYLYDSTIIFPLPSVVQCACVLFQIRLKHFGTGSIPGGMIGEGPEPGETLWMLLKV